MSGSHSPVLFGHSPHSGFGPNVNAQADTKVDLGLEPTFNVQAENEGEPIETKALRAERVATS